MKAIELIKELEYGAVVDPEKTCDTVKAGDPEKEIKKVAVAMFGTVKVLKEVIDWGADMLVLHEPLLYDHMDILSDNKVAIAKRALIDESGLVIYRDHDHIHALTPDGIAEGELHYLGLTGKFEVPETGRARIFVLDTPITAVELARLVEEKLGVAHVRIAGERDKKSTRIGTFFGAGATDTIMQVMEENNAEIVICGEVCEWKLCEYARDATAFGINRSILALGHIGSERDGMRLVAKRFQENHAADFETKYFECGEVYTYTD